MATAEIWVYREASWTQANLSGFSVEPLDGSTARSTGKHPLLKELVEAFVTVPELQLAQPPSIGAHTYRKSPEAGISFDVHLRNHGVVPLGCPLGDLENSEEGNPNGPFWACSIGGRVYDQASTYPSHLHPETQVHNRIAERYGREPRVRTKWVQNSRQF